MKGFRLEFVGKVSAVLGNFTLGGVRGASCEKMFHPWEPVSWYSGVSRFEKSEPIEMASKMSSYHVVCTRYA